MAARDGLARGDEAQAAPPDFRDVVAEAQHAQVLASWRGLMDNANLPPVLLLTGREGSGKAALLAALAAMHFCECGTACGSCQPCIWLLAGRHPELLWLASEGRLLVEHAAALQEHLELSPSPPAQWRVACIPDADRLTPQAANRLLKTLEEPPPRARLLLSTSRPGALLATVRSRCVRWRIAPPAVAQPVTPMAGVDLAPLLAATRPSEVLAAAEQLGRGSGTSLPDLLAALELQLNQDYRRVAAGGTPPGAAARQKRRALIHQARRLARSGGVPLNAQLAMEAVAFVANKGTDQWTV